MKALAILIMCVLVGCAQSGIVSSSGNARAVHITGESIDAYEDIKDGEVVRKGQLCEGECLYQEADSRDPKRKGTDWFAAIGGFIAGAFLRF